MTVKRQDILVLVEAIDSNLNGDPDAENAPRIDPETHHGLVTDVCWKRKIRDYVALVLGEAMLYVKHRGILSAEHIKAYEATGQKPGKGSNGLARQYMCDNYFDVRAFGGLMTGGKVVSDKEEDEEDAPKGKKGHKAAGNGRYDCGAVRGPVQVSFGRTIDPITTVEHSITRVALTNPGDGGGSTTNDDGTQTANSGQMGQKHTAVYGLYKFTVSVNPFLAKDTGYSEADNDLLLKALVNMLENDTSAARTGVAVRKVYVWTHDSELGAAPRHKLIESVHIERKAGVEFPRKFSDYSIQVDAQPEGVKLTELVDGLEVPETISLRELTLA